MNVVIYARYSSDRQTEQSIEGQLKECYEYARRKGYAVVGNTLTVPFPAQPITALNFCV